MVQFDRLERAIGGVPGMNVGALVGRCTDVVRVRHRVGDGEPDDAAGDVQGGKD